MKLIENYYSSFATFIQQALLSRDPYDQLKTAFLGKGGSAPFTESLWRAALEWFCAKQESFKSSRFDEFCQGIPTIGVPTSLEEVILRSDKFCSLFLHLIYIGPEVHLSIANIFRRIVHEQSKLAIEFFKNIILRTDTFQLQRSPLLAEISQDTEMSKAIFLKKWVLTRLLNLSLPNTIRDKILSIPEILKLALSTSTKLRHDVWTIFSIHRPGQDKLTTVQGIVQSLTPIEDLFDIYNRFLGSKPILWLGALQPSQKKCLKKMKEDRLDV